MFDDIFGTVSSYWPSANEVAGQSDSPAMIAPASASAGLSLQAPYISGDGDFTGRVSLSIVALGIVGLVLFYAWTYNAQGGG